MNNRASSRGFTLIELSIVLVIIGLIVGGVLVGQTLIKAAQVRSTISQLERFKTATETFVGKYGALPGDIPNASNFGFTDQTGGTAYTNGNGDGQILGTPNSGDSADPSRMENRNYWWDLIQAGLINDHVDYPTDPNWGYFGHAGRPGSDSPTTAMAVQTMQSGYMLGGWWVYYQPFFNSTSPAYLQFAGHIFTLNVCAVAGCYVANGDTTTPAMAYAIDAKLDDGLPQTGSIRAIWQGAGTGTVAATSGATGTAVCMTSSVTPYAYNVSNNTNLCSLAFQAGF